ncbi:MAG: hypothetical protein M1826_006091 [Phylliscum demangeonii]|nr:MAG: hypothetical protein M1826_006091 [Phylliscum demangeonii]
MGDVVHLRLPGSSDDDDAGDTPLAGARSPPLSALQGTWHVTHSTLPLWRNKRNVRITYTPTLLPPSTAAITTTYVMDDVVRYQTLDADRVKTVRGVDRAACSSSSSSSTKAWRWRGRGWLWIASSSWEILGYGYDDEDGLAPEEPADGQAHGRTRNEWIVTYFSKTLFTPAGLDIYSRARTGLSLGMLDAIKRALLDPEVSTETDVERRVADEAGRIEMRELAGQLFEIRQDA